MDPTIYLELVKAGFLGFAVIIMYLSYSLLGGLVNSNTPGPDSVVRLKLVGIICFLSVSVVVLGLGIYYSMVGPNKFMISFDIYPIGVERFEKVKLTADGERVVLAGNNGVTKFEVGRPGSIQLDLTDVRDSIVNLERRVDELERAKEGLTETNKNITQSSTLGGVSVEALSNEQGI